MRYVKQLVTERTPQASVFRWLAVCVVLASVILSLTAPASAQMKYVITDGDNVIVHMSNRSDPADVIEEAGLQLGVSDIYTTQSRNGVSEIHINRIQMVTVQAGTETYVVGTYGDPVQDVLASLDLTLGEEDELSCRETDATYDGMVISLTRRKTCIAEYDEPLPYRIRTLEDASLAPGEELVISEGAEGTVHYETRIVYENGAEKERTVLEETVTVKPIDKIVLCGVDHSIREQENVPAEELSFHDPAAESCTGYVPGTNLPYTDILEYDATAYYCESPNWTTTFSGTEAQVGSVAVDPDWIPLGTRMYIVSADGKYVYGYCIAEDTGSAIKGDIVDLYFNTREECINFGRRVVKIYILE